MQSELDGATAKPLLRGVSHEIAALAALVGWAAVAATAPSGAAPVLATRLLFSGAAQDGLDLGFGVAIARAGWAWTWWLWSVAWRYLQLASERHGDVQPADPPSRPFMV